MKKLIMGMMLIIASSFANANAYYGYDGLWYGNVCRTGMYYTMIYYAPIGNTCWNSGWNVYGIVTGNQDKLI